MGYEADAVPDGLVADRLESAAYSLARELEVDCINTIWNAVQGKDRAGQAYGATDVRNGKSGQNIKGAAANDTVTAANVYKYCVQAAQKLDEKKVPRDNDRFLLVTPETYALLLQDTTNFIRQGDISQRLVEEGAVGSVAGLPVYVSTELMGKAYASSAAAGSKGELFAIAGHKAWITEVKEWFVEPRLVSLDGDANVVGGSAVKGRYIYTHEVTKPETLVAISAYHA